MDEHAAFSAKCNKLTDTYNHKIPTMHWIPVLNKDLYVFRINSNSVLILLFAIVLLLNHLNIWTLVWQLYKIMSLINEWKCYEKSGNNSFCSIKIQMKYYYLIYYSLSTSKHLISLYATFLHFIACPESKALLLCLYKNIHCPLVVNVLSLFVSRHMYPK